MNYCSLCGHYYAGTMHMCAGGTPVPPQQPYAPPFPNYAPQAPVPGGFTWVPPPLTAEDVRKIIREELERRFPAGDPQPHPVSTEKP